MDIIRGIEYCGKNGRAIPICLANKHSCPEYQNFFNGLDIFGDFSELNSARIEIPEKETTDTLFLFFDFYNHLRGIPNTAYERGLLSANLVWVVYIKQNSAVTTKNPLFAACPKNFEQMFAQTSPLSGPRNR